MSVLETMKDKFIKPTYEGQGGRMISQIVSESGGLDGLIEKFNAAGYGETIKSWVSPGINYPITGGEIEKIFGTNQIENLATKFCLDPKEVSSNLAFQLPEWINSLELEGRVSTDFVDKKLDESKH